MKLILRALGRAAREAGAKAQDTATKAATTTVLEWGGGGDGVGEGGGDVGG